ALADAQPVVWASIASRLTQCVIQGGRMAEALALCEQAAARLAAAVTPPTVLLAELAAVTCRAQMNLSRYAEAEATAQQALALAAADDHLATSAERNLAGLEFLLGDTAGAERHTQAVMTVYERIGNQSELAAAREQLAAIYIATGHFNQARAAINAALRYHEQN